MQERKGEAVRRRIAETVVVADDAPNLATQILDALEQGVIHWSPTGTWLQSNQSIYDVLGFQRGSICGDYSFRAFLEDAQARGVTFDPEPEHLIVSFGSGVPFQFSCETSTHRAIACNARALRSGGYIMCFDDISEMRSAVKALAAAEQSAAEAERKAALVLDVERTRQRESERLAKLDEWLQSCKSLDELFVVVSTFMELNMTTTRGQLFLYSNSRDVLQAASAWNDDRLPEQVTPDDCWALRRGRRYYYEAEEFCFMCDHVASNLGTSGSVDRYVCIPIVAHGESVGLLHMEFLGGLDALDMEEPVKFVSRCAERISMAIANVKLRDELQDQSTRDALTGLYNRRYYIDAMRREINNARSGESSFALLAIDADHFKNFNDTHGHDAGDEVLRAIAEHMQAATAEKGLACRVGGEEFTILLPRCDRTVATKFAEDLRQSAAEMRVRHLGSVLPKVTLSIGVAIYPTHGTEAKELMKRADVALYEAKKGGRNCHRVAEGDGTTFFE